MWQSASRVREATAAIDAVWLGPRGLTLPWSARYSAYGIWLVLFTCTLAVEAILPMGISVPPVWELVLTILATYALTGFMDDDRPLGSVFQLVRNEVSAPRVRKAQRAASVTANKVKVRVWHV